MHIVSAAEFRRVHVRSWLAARVSRLSQNVVQVDVIVAAADAKGSAWSALSGGSTRRRSAGERWTRSSEGSLTWHAVAAAWLLCICVAALALGVTRGLHNSELPAATVADKTAIGETAMLAGSFQSSTRPPAQGWQRHILLTNNSREPIIEVYTSNPSAGNWQTDLLGSEFLLPGGSVLVDIDDHAGCWVDVKTDFDDGSDVVNRRVNICRAEGDAVSLR